MRIRKQDQTTVGNKHPTRYDRELIIERKAGLWSIRWNGGGEVPGPLKGLYTTEGAAKRAIERFKELNNN